MIVGHLRDIALILHQLDAPNGKVNVIIAQYLLIIQKSILILLKENIG